MKHTIKRGLALLMTVVMCLSLIPTMALAASDPVYNWGTRGTAATTLSESATDFYKETTYAELSQLSGGTSEADAPSSALYAALQKLMKDNHQTITSYNDTKDLYQYTDCQNGGGKISAFYSGTEIGPAWGSGDISWNREHTWPNSKGLGGSDENDIMMLRPTVSSNNSSRGNKAYGESAGFYDPNSVSGGTYNLRGDVARIMLYVYVRWGNTAKMWGSTGVMESLDVLIKWMTEDPVDTWELGRNDSVQSIIGTRNVFVDYPELAFLLFNEDIPNDMTTPSGEAKNHQNCNHQYVAGTPVAATCTAKGYTPYTCSKCEKTYNSYTDMLDHKYVDGFCVNGCGAAAPTFGVIDNPVAGTAYKFGMIQKNVSTTDVYYLKGGMDGYYMATAKDKDAAIDVYLEETSGGYYLYTMTNGAKSYINMVVNDTHVNGAYESKASTVYTFDAESDTVIAVVNGANYWFGTRNDRSYTTVGPVKTSYNGFYCQFYGEIGGSEGGETPHEHSYESVVTDPTCTDDGYTTYTCSCGDSYTVDGLDATGHNYVSGTCSVCGAAESTTGGETVYGVIDNPVAGTAYKFGMIQKNVSTTDVYYLKGGMDGYYMATAKDKDAAIDVYLEETSGGYYLYTLTNGAKSYINMVVSGTHVNGAYGSSASTVYTFDETSDTVIAKVSGKDYWFGTRNDKSYTTVGPCATSYKGFYCQFYGETVVGGEGGETTCEHSWNDATCQAPKTCSKCGATEGEALGHSWKDATCQDPKTCSVCGATEGEKSNEHNYVSGTCSVCGEKEPTTGGSETVTVTTSIGTYAAANGWANDKKYPTLKMDDVVTVTASGKDNTGKYYTSDKSWRTYQTESPSIVISGGDNTIVSVKITYKSSNGGTLIHNSAAIASNKVVEVNAPSITFTVGNTGTKTNGQVRITAIEVVYENGSEPECEHNWNDATCTLPKTCSKCGATEGEALGHSWKDATCQDPKTCSVCGATEGEKSNEHNYVDGACSVCGQADPDAPSSKPTTATITFDNTSKRTELTNSKQVWQENGITVTNNKSSATSNINGKYYNPIRLYAGTNLVIEYPGMTKIEFVCSYSTYVAPLKDSITTGTVEVDGLVVTVTLPEAADTYTIAKFAKQTRFTSITVYAEASCEHEWNDATCTAPKTCGLCGETEGEALGHSWNDATCAAPKTCATCGETEGEALGHTWNDATCEAPKTCSVCGATEGSALGHTYAKSMTTPPTCTNAGIVIYTCTRCGGTSASAIPAPGHTWVNGICSVCGDDGKPSEGKNPAQLCGGSANCLLHAYSDINVGAWYHDGVHYCVENSLLQGLPGDKFGPNEVTTRAQLVTILWRLEGSPVVNYLMDFDDVESDQWYTEAVRWAAAEKIVGGYGNGLFGINDAITREQMATILWRYAQYKGRDVSVGESTNILSYGDVAQVSEYAIPAMQWACGEGLIQGVASGSTMNLNPTGNANRAQTATILYRYCEESAK